MKNRVLRLAVVAMLVVAMTLTMAACAAPVAPVVEAPKAPQAPAPAPVEDVKAPVVAPAPVEDTVVDAPAAPSAEDALKADYGITVEATNKTFGAKKQNGDPDLATIKVKLPEKGFSLTEDAARYYVSYKLEAIDYEGLGDKPVKTTVATDFNTDGTVTFTNAGVYTVEFTVSVLDQGVDFGFFGIPEAEDADEYTITKTVEVSKKAVTITIGDVFNKVSAAGTPANKAKMEAADLDDLKFSDNDAKDDLEAKLDGVLYIATPAYDPKVPGVITKTLVYAEASYADEDDLLDFAEVLEEVANYTYTLGTGTINLISSYEYNEVGDVLTSVMDIPAGDYTAIAGSDQYALALKRFEALNDAQVVFLKSIQNIEATLGFASTVDIADAGKAYTTTITDAAKGTTVFTWLTSTIKTEYDKIQLGLANKKAWNDVVEAAEWGLYGNGFNVNNEFAMASFNVIDAFVKANTSVINAIKTLPDCATTYGYYTAAVSAISKAKEDAVKELFKGALAAYDKAITNGDFPYYTDASSGLKYIDNDEVDLLVKYAVDAYNALTTAEKAVVDGDTTITSVNITIANAKASDYIKAIADMSEVVESIKEITEYVKIENYAKKPSDIYATLRKLVYGEGMTTADFFGNTADKHYAIADLVAYIADDEVRAAVVAEYKAWIDVVVAFEAVKEAAVDAFDVAFDEYCADKELSNEVIALSKDGYDAIVAKIMNGGTINGIKYPTVTSIVVAEKPETIDEAKEYFEDAFDGEKIAKNLQYVSGAWTTIA